MTSATGNKALSLLELIISIAILSIGIVSILEALSFSARLTGLSSDIISAVFLAEDKLQELEFKEKHSLISKEPNTATGASDKFKWLYTLNLEPDLNLYKLNLQVKWLRANREEKISLNTYLRQ